MYIGTRSTAKQIGSDPDGRFTALYELFTGHRFGSCLVTLIIDKIPRAILVCVFRTLIIDSGWIVLFDTLGPIIRGTYIKSACRILKNIYPKWTSCNFQTPRVGLEPTT